MPDRPFPHHDVLTTPLGDAAVAVHVGHAIDRTTFDRVQQTLSVFEQQRRECELEFVPAYASVTVYYDALRWSYDDAVAWIHSALEFSDSRAMADPRRFEIPVCYGGEFGVDLAEVARLHDLAEEEVIRLHADAEYLVHMIGFLPGFPYLGGLSPRLATPRHRSPRLRIAAGSVGIAGEQTGVYPVDTPGGWQIIGRTPLQLFTPDADVPTLLQAGDIVRFLPITRGEYNSLAEARV